MGTNKNEWGLFQLLGIGGGMITSTAQLNMLIEQQFGAHASEVEAQYKPASDADANESYISIITDLSFRCPTRALLRAAVGLGGSVYNYSFETPPSFHAQELDYVFGTMTLSTLLGGGPPSPTLMQTVQHYWTSFATTGTPSAAGAPAWPKYDAQTESYMTLVDPPQPGTGLAKQCDFWDMYIQNGGTINLPM
jgi:para-nitrobenzyl esterase